MEKLNFNAKAVIFLALFTIVSLIGLNINFSKLVGAENQFFTLFQFFGPIAGGFLGAMVGAASVLLAQLVNYLLIGKELNLVNLLRLTPMIFGAYYFAKNKNRLLNDKLSIAIPIAAMAAFMLHPVGREVWYFSLYWTIPIIAKFLPDHLILRSLGATMMTHAVGGAFWIWTIPMTAAQWQALIPVVAYERALFAIGIAASYVAFNTLLNKVAEINPGIFGGIVNIEQKYVLAKF